MDKTWYYPTCTRKVHSEFIKERLITYTSVITKMLSIVNQFCYEIEN